jgi:putative ABC transport system permease protein
MAFVRRAARRLRNLLFRRQDEAEMTEEMSFHLDERAAKNEAEGLTPREARYAAQKRFGNFASLQEHAREHRRWMWLEYLLKDSRFAIRQLSKNPGFTAVGLFTLALGIGACTAIVSVVNSVLLRPLPFPQSERLVSIHETELPQVPRFTVAAGNYYAWREQAKSFRSLAAVREDGYTLTGSGEPKVLSALCVTDNYFSTLGVQPILGRDFHPDEDEPGSGTVVLLSNGFWQREFGGRTDVIGRDIQLDGRPFTIIGVMPKSFREAEIVTPAAYTAQERQDHGKHRLSVIGRLRDGIDLANADAELKSISGWLAKTYPGTNKGWSVQAVSFLDNTVGDVRPLLLTLLGAVGFLLLIACANIANLLLARASVRTREFAIRAALGAKPGRIVRQVLTETVVLGLSGGVLGGLAAKWGVVALLKMVPNNLPRAEEVSVDERALLVTCAIAITTGIVVGLAPALQLARVDLNAALKETGRSAGGGRSRLRSTLVIVEVAFALILLVGAGLLIRTFANLNAVDPGFNASDAFVASLELPTPSYPDRPRQAAFVDQAIIALAAIPGVEAVGAAPVLPFSGDNFVLDFYREDQPRPAPGHSTAANYYAVTPDYFRAMGIRVERGRSFDGHDRIGSAPVAIINETMAKQYFAGVDPIGRRINLTNGPEAWREIVGVVGDTKHNSLDAGPLPQMYEPFAQSPLKFVSFVIRAPGAHPGLASAVRVAIQAIDPNQAVDGPEAMGTFLAHSVARQRLSATLFAAFAGSALLLAAVGVYGVMAYAVDRRVCEFGIRMALGAQRRDVFRLVLLHCGRLFFMGLCSGLIGAVLLSRFLSAMLFGVSASDPITFAEVAVLLASVAALACYLPARRATKVNPMLALRAE